MISFKVFSHYIRRSTETGQKLISICTVCFVNKMVLLIKQDFAPLPHPSCLKRAKMPGAKWFEEIVS